MESKLIFKPEKHVHTEDIATTRISVYPNPTRGEITVSLPDDGLNRYHKIEIYNSAGVQILRTENVSAYNKLDLSTFAKGIYFCKIIGDKHNSVEKIIFH